MSKLTQTVLSDCSKRRIEFEAYSPWRFNGTAEMHIDAQKVGRRRLQDYLYYNVLVLFVEEQLFVIII